MFGVCVNADADDASVGDAERGFVLNHQFVQACTHLCSLLMSENDEESVSNAVRSGLRDLWFTGQDLPPVNTCIEEIVATLSSDTSKSGGAWLEILLSNLPSAAQSRARQYVELLFGKIAAVENISPIQGCGRPSSFNDFDTRARMLIPVLQVTVFSMWRFHIETHSMLILPSDFSPAHL